MKNNTKIFSALAACSLILAGCSNNNDDEPTKQVTSAGTITGFGSVYVNGTRYITDNSNIIHNGTSGTDEANLKVGMKVVVSGVKPGDGSSSIAAEVKYLSDVSGQIQNIDIINLSLTVLGQTYFVTTNTKFDSLLFKELTIGQFVEISASKGELDKYTANYIEAIADTNEQQLVGKISQLDSDLKTFTIGGLSVDYTTAEVEGILADGTTVEIETIEALVNNVFIANEVEVKQDSLLKGEVLAVSGIINLINGDNFILEEQSFTLTPNTVFTQGSKEDLAVGSQVSLLASITNSESLNVDEIRIELATEISIEAVVEDITETSFTLLGQQFYVDQYTQYEDDSDLEQRDFSFSDINVGDLLEVDAFDDGSKLVSRSIEREEVGTKPEDEEVEVEGKVDHIELPSLSIKGIVINTTAQTEFESAQGQIINQAEFFATITLEDTVEAELVFQDGQWLAVEVEIEDVDSDNKKVELVGMVDSFVSSTSFTVNGFDVTTTAFTKYKAGSAADLAQNKKLELEGRVNNSGQIVATEIEFLN